MKVTIWHNPQCSKSRQALELLKERGIEPAVRQYLQDPPSEQELRGVLKKLGTKDPQALVRKREKLYEELSVGDMSAGEAIAAMAAHSRLIERPVVIAGRKARIGRPTEAILEILDAEPAKKTKDAAPSGLPAALLTRYDTLVASLPDAERKGKTMPYTSRNGHMFSFLTKEGELALRLPKDAREALVQKHDAKPCVQHGRVMKEYVVVPDAVLRNTRAMKKHFATSWEYIGTLKPKPTKRTKTGAAKR